MTEKLREQVSALVDEELSDGEVALVLKRLANDNDLKAAFARYHTIGALIRGLSPELASSDFAGQVSERIAAEADTGMQRPARLAGFGRAAGLAAVAASVAVVAVLTLRTTGDPASSQPVMAATDLSAESPAVVVPPYREQRNNAQLADVQAAQLADKLLSHGAVARTAWSTGVISLRNVGRDDAEEDDSLRDPRQNEDGALK